MPTPGHYQPNRHRSGLTYYDGKVVQPEDRAKMRMESSRSDGGDREEPEWRAAIPLNPSPAPEASCGARLSARRVLTELPLAVLVAALVSIVIQLPIAKFGLSEPTALPEIAAGASAAVLLALLFAALLWRRRGGAAMLGAVWVVLSAFATLVLAWPLEPTRLYYGGLSTDQLFRLQYLSRLADSPLPVDMNYSGLPPYYPPGWFWLGARFADLTGMPAWEAFKPYALLTIAVTSVGCFTLWSVVVRRRVAALLAVATTISGFLDGIDEPYAWMSVAWLAPITVLCWHLLRCRSHQHRAGTIGVGAFLGFTAITYTLYLGFMTLVVLALASAAWCLRVGTSRLGEIRRLAAHILMIGLVAGIIALTTWTPFLVAKLGGAPSNGAANRYLPPESMLPFPMLQPTLFGVLCLAGFCWLVLAARRSATATALLILTGTIYAWFALSTLAVAVGTTLLAFRTTAALEVSLAVAGVLALLDGWHWLRSRIDTRYLLQATALAFLLGLAGAVVTVQTALTTSINAAAQPAYNDYHPTGENAQRQSDPAQPGAWNDELVAAIADLSGYPPNKTVLLTTHYPLLSFAPYWGFQQETPHYANPLAEFDLRAAEIRDWAAARDQRELCSLLDRSRFTAPNSFVLRRGDDGLHITLSRDAFPHQPNVQIFDVRFDEALFEGPAFAKRDVGPFVVIARHQSSPTAGNSPS